MRTHRLTPLCVTLFPVTRPGHHSRHANLPGGGTRPTPLSAAFVEVTRHAHAAAIVGLQLAIR